MDPSVIFAWIIAVLAGLACIGALAVMLVAEWFAIRRTIERHRNPPLSDADYWRQQRTLHEPAEGP